MSAHLEVLALNKLAEKTNDIWELLALVLAVCPQGQVHQESCRILKSVVREGVQLISDGLKDPSDHVVLDHLILSFFPEREFLQGSKGVLSQVGILFALSVE